MVRHQEHPVSDIGILEAKTHLSSCVDRALAGEEVVLTRHGKRLVKLVPVEPQARRRAQLTELVQRIQRDRARQPQRREPAARELIAHGRKW
jgi:prevent-host-death family protein